MGSHVLPKILVVDDDSRNRQLLSELLKDEYKVLLAKSGPMALDLVRRQQPDMILLDVVMPEMDGYEVLRQLKADNDTRGIPVIFISALDSLDDEERGLTLGAADYIGKPFHPPIVRARVRNHMHSLRQQRLLERLAHYDPLTEIPNRRRLMESLKGPFVPGTQISVVMVDVDHFKRYNDHYGHGGGDRVLRQVAAVLRDQLRDTTDLIARYGGEEFAVLMPHTDRLAGQAAAERMRHAVAMQAIPHAAAPSGGNVTVSVGGTTVLATSIGTVPDSALTEADQQLYRAKNQGRNQVAWLA